jgi:hypothetical protein
MAKKVIRKSLRVASPGMLRVIVYDPVRESERVEGDFAAQTERQRKKVFDLVDEHNRPLIGIGTFFITKRVFSWTRLNERLPCH